MPQRLLGWAETDADVLLTPWTFVHVGVGALAKSFGIGLLKWNLLHAAYEAKDLLFVDVETRNSLLNSVGDQLSTNVGYLLYKSFMGNWPLVFTIGAVVVVAQNKELG